MTRKNLISAVIAAVTLPFITYFICEDIRMAGYLKDPSEIKHKQVYALDMSESDRIKDFDYLWKAVSEGLPAADKYKTEFGIDIYESEERYRKEIEKSETNLEFFCTVNSVLNDIPSVHTGFFFPDYEIITDYTCLGSEIVCSNPYLKSATELWNRELKNYYRESRALDFVYADGRYWYSPDSSEVRGELSGFCIKTINGEAPEEYILNYLSSSTLKYDDVNEKLYRNNLIFNDSKGEKISLVLENMNGDTVETDLYYELCEEYVKALQPYLHGMYKAQQQESEIGYISNETDNRIVYIRLNSFSGDNGQEIYSKIKKYCFDKDVSVILDLRKNGGGTLQYASDNVYPFLFSSDIDTETKEYILNSAGNKLFFGGINGIVNRYSHGMKKPDTSETAALSGYASGKGYYSYNIEIKYKGLNTYSPDVYILVSDETASAADYFVSTVSELENTVIIGDRTAGEKTGGQFMTMLPESRLVYCYNTAVCFNDDGTDNSMYGTVPDIRMRDTVKEITERAELSAKGENAESLACRLKWDDTLIKTIDMINKKRGRD